MVAELDLASQLIHHTDGFAWLLWLCSAPDLGKGGNAVILGDDSVQSTQSARTRCSHLWFHGCWKRHKVVCPAGRRMGKDGLREGVRCLVVSHLYLVEDGTERAGVAM